MPDPTDDHLVDPDAARPWAPEHPVPEDLARVLLREQFPQLEPLRLRRLGAGWDNDAYLVNDEWIFRFPRRSVAVDLMRTEIAVLPALASRLPLPIPVPVHVGREAARFPWPWAGYRRLPGRLAYVAGLDDAQRTAAAQPLATWLATLHAQPADEFRRRGAPRDEIRRLDVAYRAGRTRGRLAALVEQGVLDRLGPWEAIVASAPLDYVPGESTLVHGDLDGRHVLVDDDGLPSGVIDWGDVHIGDATVDLALAAGFLPQVGQRVFREVYGPIDDAAWRVARFLALHAAVAVLAYAHDIGDDDLLAEGLRTLDVLRSGS